MKYSEGTFEGLNNYRIYFQRWLPEEKPEAVILIAHGYAEHSGRYMNLVNHFVPLGYRVYALDHRGHGKSEGNLDEIGDFSMFVTDLRKFFDIIRKECPDEKIFLTGHSMGSVISLLYSLDYQHDLAGLVISGGGLSKPDAPPLPEIPPDQPLDSSFLSRDPEVIKAYEEDPLVYRGPIPRSIQSGMFKVMDLLSSKVKNIDLPVLIMAGDGCMDGPRSRTLYEKIGADDKSLKLYHGLMHEIFNEPEHPQVMADMEAWLEKHL